MKRLVLTLIALLPVLVASGAETMNFLHFGAEQGMGQIAIWGLCQDGHGTIWSLSNGEIYSYDGFESRRFPGEDVNDLMVDSDGRLWFCGTKKIGWYDRSLGQFVETSIDSPHPFSGIEELSPGRMLLYSYDECRLYDVQAGTNTVLLGSEDGISVNSMCVVDGKVYLGGYGGTMMLWSPDSGEPPARLCEVGSPVQSLCINEDGRIWMGTRGGGLFCFDPAQGLTVHLERGDGPGDLLSNQVRALCPDSAGRIWIGSLLGLDILDPETLAVSHFQKDEYNTQSLSHNTVRCILRDDSGGMWVGTYFGGINYWHPARDRFKHLSSTPPPCPGQAERQRIVMHRRII